MSVPDPIRRKQYTLSDVGNAQRLVDLHGRDFRWVSRWKSWIVWNGMIWARDEHGEMERRAKAVVLDMYQQARDASDADERRLLASHAVKSEYMPRLRAMIDTARSEPGVAVDYTVLDQQPMLLPVRNGTIDLRTGTLKPHDRAHLLTKFVDIEYDPSAECPLWLNTLRVIFSGDESLVQYVQRAVGYSLTGDTSEQCLHLCHGTGSNGKSTLLDILGELAGAYGQQADFTTFLERRSEGPRSDVARLNGARLVRSSEVGDNKRLNEGLIKSLTGGDTITARFLYSDDFEFKPQFKLWLAANHKPVIRGTDYAIWRRMRLIPFEVTITPEQRDDQLPQKLRAELSGILSWAVEGCQQWLAEGLRPPERVTLATADYRSESDIIAAFLHDCCEEGQGFSEAAGKLYTAYKRWSEENGEYAMTGTRFGRDLTDRGYKATSTRSGKVRHGLRLAFDEKPDFWGRRRDVAA